MIFSTTRLECECDEANGFVEAGSSCVLESDATQYVYDLGYSANAVSQVEYNDVMQSSSDGY